MNGNEKDNEYDIFVDLLMATLEYYPNNVKWSENPEKNKLAAVIETLNTDYHELLRRADKIVFDYIFEDEMDDEKFLKIAGEFMEVLYDIHPYFGERIYRKKSSYYIIPGLMLFRFQVFYKVIDNIRLPRFIFRRLEDYIPKLLDPLHHIMFKEDAKVFTDSAVKEFRKLKNDYEKKKYKKVYDLSHIEETLDNFKRQIFVYSSSKLVKNEIGNVIYMSMYSGELCIDIQRRIEECKESIAEHIIKETARLTDMLTPQVYNTFAEEFNIHKFIYYSFDQLMFFYFENIISNQIKVKVCKRCGRIFIANDRREKFCDYKTDDTDRSCKELGPQEDYTESLKHHPLKDLRRRILGRFWQNKNYSPKKYSDHDWDITMLDDLHDSVKNVWKQHADLIIDEYNNDRMTLDEAKDEMEHGYRMAMELIQEIVSENRSVEEAIKKSSKIMQEN